MTKMIRWYDEDHELNVVLYPQDNTVLRMLQQKLQQFFPFAKSLEDYLFPAMFCQTNIDQFKEQLDVWKSISGTCPCCFRAKNLIVENNHLLIEYLPATREDATAMNALLAKVSPGEPGHLVMPIAWLPADQRFSCQILEQIQIILKDMHLEIVVDLFHPEFYFAWDWNEEWENALGSPRPLSFDQLFPDLDYDVISCDLNDACSFASFHIPRGYWYCTSSDREAKLAETDLNVYQFGGYVKMVDLRKDPPDAVMYDWIASEYR